MIANRKHTIIKNDIAFRLSGRFRNSLSQLGLSRDMHLFDLDLSHLAFFYSRRDNDSFAFIREVQEFYYSLDPLDRLMFINEYLEKGRHGSFWWMYYFTKEDYALATKDMNKLVQSRLGGSLYGSQA